MSTKPPALRVPNSSSSPFRADKSGTRGLTSDQIADHLAAFKRAGGKVEVLGVTRTLRQIGAPVVPEAPAAAATATKPAARKK